MPFVVAVAVIEEDAELNQGDRIVRDVEVADGAGNAVFDLRVRVIRVPADLDRHLTALNGNPIEVR